MCDQHSAALMVEFFNGNAMGETLVPGARWDEERSAWEVQTSAGTHEADVLLTACGQLSVPSVPQGVRQEATTPGVHSVRQGEGLNSSGSESGSE